MTPLQISNEIKRAHEVADRNGCKLDICADIDIIAVEKHPYSRNARIGTVNNFGEVIVFFKGYEQKEFEVKNG